MAKKKNSSNMIIAVLVVVIIALVAVFIGPKVVHECVGCGETIIGAGYEPSELAGFLSQEEYEENDALCEECAEEVYALKLALGDELEDFERDLF